MSLHKLIDAILTGDYIARIHLNEFYPEVIQKLDETTINQIIERLEGEMGKPQNEVKRNALWLRGIIYRYRDDDENGVERGMEMLQRASDLGDAGAMVDHADWRFTLIIFSGDYGCIWEEYGIETAVLYRKALKGLQTTGKDSGDYFHNVMFGLNKIFSCETGGVEHRYHTGMALTAADILNKCSAFFSTLFSSIPLPPKVWELFLKDPVKILDLLLNDKILTKAEQWGYLEGLSRYILENEIQGINPKDLSRVHLQLGREILEPSAEEKTEEIRARASNHFIAVRPDQEDAEYQRDVYSVAQERLAQLVQRKVEQALRR